MKIAVIGAGWAGLSAAVRAFDLGHDITVFEASHTLGGRARGVRSRKLNVDIDNGQHIMLGAYSETLALMERLGVDAETALWRQALRLEAVDGSFMLQVGHAPTPFNMLAALLGAKGLSLRDKSSLLRIMRQLQKDSWIVDASATVQQWLDMNRQSQTLRRLFWIPLCVAALNTPIHQACAQLFANVLRDSLGALPGACDTVLPRVNLSCLWPNRVEGLQGGPGRIRIRRGAVVTRLAVLQTHDVTMLATTDNMPISKGVVVNDEPFDAAVLACNAPSTRRLLQTLPRPGDDAAHTLLRALSDFSYVPIATVTLEFKERWQLPRAMYLLLEDRDAGHYGQWLFHCPAFMNDDRPYLAQVVISDAGAALDQGEDRLIQSIQTQLATQTRRFGPMPTVTAYDFIVEKRATFAAVPRQMRPGAATPWPGVWLAGDWTDTGYPAVLEGAVCSGRRAAEGMHQRWVDSALFSGRA